MAGPPPAEIPPLPAMLRSLLARLVRKGRLPLSQAEEKALAQLERRFLAFVGAGEVGLPGDLRRALFRAL